MLDERLPALVARVMLQGVLLVDGVQQEHGLVDESGQAGSQERAEPEDPHAAPVAGPGRRVHALRCLWGNRLPQRRLAEHRGHGLHGFRGLQAAEGQKSRAEGACGVDGAAVDGDQHTVGHEDGEADGQAGLAAVHLRLWVAGRLQHHEDQEEGAKDLADEGVPPVPLQAHAVGPQALRHVQLRGEDGAEDGGPKDGAHHLRAEVEEPLKRVAVAGEDQAKGHGAVEVPAAVVSDGVGQGGDGEAKDQGHHENPARNHGGRLAAGAVSVVTAATRATRALDSHGAAAADDHEESHADKLGQARDERDISVEDLHLPDATTHRRWEGWVLLSLLEQTPAVQIMNS